MIEQLDIFGAIAQAEAEARAQAAVPQEFQPGDYLRGHSLTSGVKEGWFDKVSMSGMLILKDADGKQLCLVDAKTAEKIQPPIPRIEIYEPDQGLQVGDRVTCSVRFIGHVGAIVAFEDNPMIGRTARVQFQQGPAYPCALQTIKRATEGGDRHGR